MFAIFSSFDLYHYRRKEILSGGGGGGGEREEHEKEHFLERHYFLRLQQQFPVKWGGGGTYPVPTTLYIETMLYFYDFNY